jgi:hypothetical protein
MRVRSALAALCACVCVAATPVLVDQPDVL